MKLCGCGCGRAVPIATYTSRAKGIVKGEPVRFVNGHNLRNREARDRAAAFEVPNPGGLCMCGCGKPAPIAKKTRMERGQVEGMSFRFIKGHNSHKHTDEAKALIAAAGRGRRHSEESKRRQSEIKLGELNPYWKGGRTKIKGRTLIRVGKDHPMANSSGYVFEHRLVLAASLGRFLSADEHVHHLDFDSANNAPENLIVVSRSEHSRIHRLVDQSGLSVTEAMRLALDSEVAA